MMALGKPRVLIVEDDPDLLVILRVNLSAAGLDPMLAGDGRTAIDRVVKEHPDVVVLDVMLPGVDGWQVLEELHALGDPAPVVVCSAKKNVEDRSRAAELGAVAYVVKPFDIDLLVDSVLDAVRRRGGEAGRLGEPGLAPA
jgi:two-component system response regulator PrrA